MDLPGKRIRKWREHLGLNGKQFEAATGIPYSTLKTLENNEDPDKKPSFDVLAKVLQTYGQVNPDWLILGTGPMLRDGRTLTPAPKESVAAQQPTEGLTSGPATVAEAENILLKEQVTDLRADKLRLIAENEQLRKKSSDSPDAAGTTPAPTAPKTPTPTCGFMTAARREQLAAEFNRFLEEQEEAVEAAELS